MRLLRLELQGFKSFLDRTILTFEPGITGVVGPNGCGKSNIVDAILWVMGEQSPNHLRGKAMTDVIFNGSESRAPTSMAEVSLIMDREGVPLAPQFAAFDKSEEISITRRVYRDGSTEYLINKVTCRLRDIHELFMDTGVGRRAYSIIEQGQIDRMINVKPEDRRFLFEEVAGITKYKAKRKEAEKKLEATNQNLLRLQDIITELEKQIRSLKIQATRAKKYKEIKSELEVVDLYILGRSLTALEKQLAELQEKKNAYIEERSGFDARFAQVDAEVTEMDIKRIDEEKEQTELSNKEREYALKIEQFERQYVLLDQRKQFIRQSSETLTKEETENREQEAKLLSERTGHEQEKIELENQIHELEMGVSEMEQGLVELQTQKSRMNQRRESLQDKVSSLTEKEIGLQSQQRHTEERRHDLEENEIEIRKKISDTTVAIENQTVAVSSAEVRIAECSARSQQVEREVSDTYTECQETSSQLSELEDRLFKAREDFHSIRSRLESLKELQENLEGYSPTAREILLRLTGEATDSSIPHAVPLAEVLKPEAALEDHLEMLLGADMNTLLVKTRAEAETMARLIVERGLERVRIASVEDLEVQDAGLGVSDLRAQSLVGRVSVSPGYEKAVQRWLGKVFLCTSQDDVFALRSLYPGNTFLSEATQIIAHGDGSITSGAVTAKTGIFARRREIEELTVKFADLEAQLQNLTSEREALLKRLEEQEQLHDQLKDRLSSIHIESVEHRKEREKLQAELARSQRELTNLESESDRNRSQVQTIEHQLEQFTSELENLAGEKVTATGELETAQTEIQSIIERFDQQMEQIHAKKVEGSTLGERVNGVRYKLDKLLGDVAQLGRRLETIRQQRAQEEQELVRLDGEAVEVASQKEFAITESHAIMAKLSDIKQAFNETCHHLARLREEKDELQDRRNQVIEELQEVEVKMAQEQSQLDQVKNISLERYQREAVSLETDRKLALEQLPLLAAQLEVTWDLLLIEEQESLLKEHLKTLKEKIERYGEVNLTAISEFDEVQKRFEFLSTQKADLDRSIQILHDAIIKIDESTKSRFEDTFNAVNRKFKEIFPILFNGGKAELSLTNAENMLEAGVDVMVQPPGKRLQSISLLSGGEKALTAVSLVLAIFARKPSPFCLLDEVDAPLDDANVSRFNTVIRKMAEKTQFIVITHNKKTMEIAEALYGVTMERAGVSKMTSVRMN